MPEAPAATRWPRWVAVAMLGAVSLAAYVLLLQRSEYGDGVLFLELIHQGRLWSWHAHHLYMPMVAAWADLLAPLGVGLYESAALLSVDGPLPTDVVEFGGVTIEQRDGRPSYENGGVVALDNQGRLKPGWPQLTVDIYEPFGYT